ncbi:MAG TPA: hypothetical protein VMC62_03785 [Longilinea sp.]|nr:hypothetical protein [Longilinea sp.]
MKRPVVTALIKMCAESILVAVVIGIVVGLIGYLNKWGTSLEYANAFFIAGCLVFVAGASSRLGAGRELDSFQRIHAKSFHNMSSGERVSFIVDASSSFHLVILGLLSGGLLILASVLVTKLT